MKNPTDITDEYLEFLAGRRKKAPVLEDDDKDILEVTRTLRSLRAVPVPGVKFKESLKSRVLGAKLKETSLSHAEKTPRPRFRQFAFRFGLPAVVVAAVVAAVVMAPDSFFSSLLRRNNLNSYVAEEARASTVTLEVDRSDALGIDPAAHFILRAKDGVLTLADVKEKLNVVPDTIEFTVEEKSANTFEIIPSVSLPGKTVISVTFAGIEKTGTTTSPRTYSWAFQVRDVFQVVGTLPRDKAANVTLNSGIEITFSAPGITKKQFASSFSIEPPVAGRVEEHGRTLAYVPSKGLNEKTLYTVTLRKGLKPEGADQAIGDDFVFRFETGPAHQQGQATSKPQLATQKVFETIGSGNPIVFASESFPQDYASSNDPKPYQYTFVVYQYAAAEPFIAALTAYQGKVTPWAQYANDANAYPLAGLKKVGTFKTESRDGVFTLGTSFEKGYYLADSTSNGAHSQIPFVVSDLGAYVVTTKTDTLVWANDLKTVQPVNDAEIALTSKDQVARTGSDGIATFTTPEPLRSASKNMMFATVRSGDSETVVILGAAYPSYGYYGMPVLPNLKPSTDRYYSYLSTDRQIYQPTDTVRLWGIIKDRDTRVVPPRVHIDVVQRSYEGRYSLDLLKSFDVTTTAAGTFIGYVDLRDVSVSGYPEIVMSVDGETVQSKSVSFETYKKSPYSITVTPRSYALIAGDPITYDIATAFFDGTAVPNVKLKLESKMDSNVPDVTTDAQGKAVYAKGPTSANDYSSSYLSLVPVEPSEGDIHGTAYVSIYPSSLQLDAKGELKGTTATVSGTVKNIHPELADPTSDDPFGKVIGEGRSGQLIEAKVIAIKTREIAEGAVYDFLAKMTIPKIRYETYDEEVASFTLHSGARGAFSKSFTVDPKFFYRVELKATDSKERNATTQTYLWSQSSYGGYNPYGLTLVDTAQADGATSVQYAIGDTAHLKLVEGSQSVVKKDGTRFLFITAQRGLRDHVIQDSPALDHTFAEQDVPMLSTRAVRFNGSGFREAFGPQLDFKESTRRLAIVLTPDRETYAPGDTVTVGIHVADGAGTSKKARVGLRAVDEAVVSLQGGQFDDPLASIYGYVGDGVLASYISHEAVSALFGGEKGGGGGEERMDFKDTAMFTEVETDASGNASASFKAPDNLTSWRISAQAVTDDLYLGIDTTLLPVRKPLLVVPEFSDTMLVGDQQNMTASAYGTGVAQGSPITFSFSVDGVPSASATVTGKAFEPVTYALPSLDEGDHTIHVTASSGALKDSIAQIVHVTYSNSTARTVRTSYLERNEQPVMAEYGRTTVRIADADRNLVYGQLWQLLGNPYARLDDTVAARIASAILEKEFGESTFITAGDPMQFLTDKGLALYVIGSENVEYGALAAGDPSLQAIEGKLIGWFRRVVDDSKSNTEQVAQALYGLAQLHQPVLPELHALLALDSLPDTSRLTVALGLEALGAKEDARPVARMLIDRYGEAQDAYYRLTLGENSDDKIVSTARMAILAAGLGLDQRYALLEYLGTHPPKDTVTHLEQALALERLLANAGSSSVQVTYRLDGKEETVSLGPKEAVGLTLDEVQAKTFEIVSHTGNVSVVTGYGEPFDQAKIPVNTSLTVDRTYTVEGKQTTEFKKGDVVKVELRWAKKEAALGTNFGIVDVLPTGLRPLTNPWLFRSGDPKLYYPYAVEHNRLKFYAGPDSFYYYARVVSTGTSIAEPPMVQAFDAPSNIAYGKGERITIR